MTVPISVARWPRLFSRWDALVVLIVVGLLIFLGEASRHLMQPLTQLQRQPISLDPANLPEYAARSVLRMLAAMVLSLVFTFTYATFAAKSKHAERVLIPLLDILQSVPILGVISVTVVFFMGLAPGRVLGAEFAVVFAVFTSQAWNMAFSFYQSLRTIPTELNEAARNLHLNPWMKFWRLEVPFGMPQLIWNMMMSMSGGWFFVVASEAISVGNTTITLPGIGAYISTAIDQRNLTAVFWAIGAMLIVILLYDQLLFRPLVAWADKFRYEQEAGILPSRSWLFDVSRRSGLVAAVKAPFLSLGQRLLRAHVFMASAPARPQPRVDSRLVELAWNGVIVLIYAAALALVVRYLATSVSLADVGTTLLLGLYTLIRVFVLIAIATLIWVPIGVWIGTRPRVATRVQPLAQFLAAFPANLLFPIAVSLIVAWKLNPNIWLSPLMILGTQWYILFNVIAGAAAIPAELRAAGTMFHVGGWLWWRKIALPAVFPHYVTGAITASGGSWNASIVSEVASWGNEHLKAAGLGAYIADQTERGDFHRIVLGIIVMSLYVVIINRGFWRPLYYYAERKFRMG
jgi:NitT/TauT family transport system permease protein